MYEYALAEFLRALFESDADPVSATPHHLAKPLEIVAGHEQRKLVGNVKRSGHFKSRAGVRDILDDAVDLALSEPDRCGFKRTTALNSAFHGMGYLIKI